jgi:hypothetical protein
MLKSFGKLKRGILPMGKYLRSPLYKYHNHHLALSIFLAFLLAVLVFLPFVIFTFSTGYDLRVLFILIPLGAYLGFKAGRANREYMTLTVTIISLLLVIGFYVVVLMLFGLQFLSLAFIYILAKELFIPVLLVLLGVWFSWGLVA